MRIWAIAAMPLVLAATAGCDGNVANRNGDGRDRGVRSADAGPQATQNYALSGFTGVIVTGPDDVTIRQGEIFSITAKGPKSEIDDLEIKRDGTTLSIGRKREGFSFGNRNHDGLEIAVTLPKLRAVRLTGSGSIEADSITGDAVEAVLTGSGDLKLAQLNGKRAEITLSGSGDVEIAGGAIDMAEVSVTGSGDVDAGGLVAKTIEVSVTGSGNVEAQSTGTADVNILGSGDVEISGGAACSTTALGSGTVTCK